MQHGGETQERMMRRQAAITRSAPRRKRQWDRANAGSLRRASKRQQVVRRHLP